MVRREQERREGRRDREKVIREKRREEGEKGER
jgi:hypothetical protein